MGALPAAATHLLGGEMNYKYLDANGPANAPFRYQITVLVYLNKEPGSVAPDGRPSVDITFYNKSQGGARISTVTVPRTSFVEITPPSPGTCTLPNSRPPRVTLAKYVTVVSLPNSFEGYYAVYTDSARNIDVTNLLDPGNTNMTLYADIAPPLLPNTSPVFSDTAVAVICQGDTSLILNNAYDADGDRLTYTFGTPYQGSAPFNTFSPPPPVYYAAGYSQTQPFGPGRGSFASLNASTGLSRYASPIQGKFVVAVDVREYRTVNGREMLVGTTRRDIQLVSRVCQPNQAPLFSPPSVAVRDYTIEEGQTVSFNIVASDPENQSLVMRVNSVLLDGSGPFDASLNNNQGTLPSGTPIGGASISGTSPVTGSFRFASRCGNARATPYDVIVTVTDNACSSKSIAEIFRITVTRASGPNRITGDSVVCDRGQARTYTAQGPATGAYRWTVRGGTIQGAATGRSVQVLWNSTAAAGSLKVEGLSVLNCPTDSVSKPVTLRGTSSLTTSPNTSICLGGSATLTASGAQSYTWTGGGQTYTGASITVSPTQTTTYTVQATDGTCTFSRQVTVTVTPTAVANAGATQTVCSGTSVTLGTPAVAGYTYQWSPATGLSSATAAQPTVTLTNTTGAAQTSTYTLTATTTGGCFATSTVRVVVNPAAVADAGPSRTVCSGLPVPLGTPALPGATYQWSPATGLNSATTAQPTLTLTNTTATAQTLSYSVTVTTAQGCTATSTVQVTINPAAVADAGADRAVCSGETTTLGTAATAGTTYQWSPATGLSSSTAAQPTFSLPNLGTSPQVYTYTLTATTADGCVETNTVRVTVHQAAVANAGTDRAVCSGEATTLGTAAVAGTTYRWSPAAGLSSPTASQPTLTLSNMGASAQAYTYTLTATTAQGCVATSTVQVTINPAAVATAGPDRSVCSGETTTLGTVALPGTTYQWSPAAGLSSTTTAQPTFSLTNTGATPLAYTYTLTATTANSCVATSTVRLTVNPAAVANAGPAVALCDGQRITLGTPAVAGTTYQWSPAAGLSSPTAARPVLTAINQTASPLIQTYTLTATTANGCVATSAVQVTINPRPAADTIQGSRSVCPTVQGVAYSIRNPRGTVYQWIVRGGTIASGQGTSAITVNWGAASATASVQAFRLNSFGCSSDTMVLPVRVNQQLATEKPAGPLQVCQSAGPFTYQTPYTNGSVYAWQIVGGTQVSTSQGAVEVRFTRPGIAKLVVTESSNPAGGICRGVSDTLYVNVLPAPAANLAISGPSRVCASTTSLSFALPGAPSSSYAFSLNGAALPGSGSTVTLPTPAASTTPYTLTARETNANGCAGPVYTTTFSVVAPLAITGPASYCPEARTGLAYAVASLPGGQYQWTVTGATIVSGQGTNAIGLDVPAGGATVSLAVTETTSASCAASFTIRPDNASVALTTASVDAAANDQSITLALAVPNNAGNASQVRIMRREAGSTDAFTAVGTVANTAVTFTDKTADADAHAYEYRLDLTNACGTVLISQQHTTILTRATAAEPTDTRQTGTVQVAWTAYQGFDVKEYRILRVTDNSVPELVQTVGASTWSLTLQSGKDGFNQCYRVQAISTDATARTSFSNDACVTFENKLGFYNIITPNGDAKNDVLIIDNVQLYPRNTLTIFNRYGKQVYETRNYRNTFGGEGCGAGMYYYLFKLDNGTSYKGWFEIAK